MLSWKTCLRAGVTVVILFLLTHYWTSFTEFVGLAIKAAVPLILGCVLAYIINILMSFYEKILPTGKNNQLKKGRRPLCIILAYFSAVFVVFFIIRMIVPELKDSLQLLIEKLPGQMNRLYVWLNEHLQMQEWLSEETFAQYRNNFQNVDWQTLVKNVANWLSNGVGNAMSSIVTIVSSVFSTIVTSIIAFIFSIYLLSGKERLGNQFYRLMKNYLGDKATEKILYVLNTFHHSFHNFIVGQMIEAVILGALCTIGMLILRLPYATMVGSLVGFTALIPVAGAYIGAIVGSFMIFTVSPLKTVVFLVFLVILQQLEGNIIYPRVVGASIGLPGIWVLAAVTIGGGVLGIGGMLIGVPFTASVYQLLKVDMRKRNQKIEFPKPKIKLSEDK